MRSISIRRAARILAVLGLGLASCSAPRDEPRPPAGRPLDPLPATKLDSLALEGLQEPMTFVLFDGRRDFVVPFTTYVPEEIEGRRVDTDAVRFVACFEGVTNEDAFLQVLLLPADISEGDVRARVDDAARDGAIERRADAPMRFPWSIVEREYARGAEASGWKLGMVAAARRQDRYILVTLQYPETWEEGFVPRAACVLEQWRWGTTRQEPPAGF